MPWAVGSESNSHRTRLQVDLKFKFDFSEGPAGPPRHRDRRAVTACRGRRGPRHTAGLPGPAGIRADRDRDRFGDSVGLTGGIMSLGSLGCEYFEMVIVTVFAPLGVAIRPGLPAT